MTINYLDSKRISMTSNVTFEQASNNDSRTFGVGGRTALGVKLSAGHSLVGSTVRTFSVIVNQDPSGAGDIKAYVIRSGYGSNDQVAESTASTLPTGTGNTTFNITFTFSSDVSILANDIIAFTNVGMTSVSSAKTSSSDIDPNAEALCVVSGTAFTFSDFVTMSGTYNNLAYKTTSTAKPTNVQDNSILVEKDTGRRYWRTPESSGADTTTTNSNVNDVAHFEGANPANSVIGEQITSGNALIGQTITSLSFWLYKLNSGSSGTETFTFGVWNSSGANVHEFGTVTRGELPQGTAFGNAVKFTKSTGSYVLQTNDILGIRTNSAPASAWTVEVTQRDSDVYSDGQRAIFVQGVTPTTSAKDIGFEVVSNTVTPATWTMEPTFRDDFSTNKGWTNLTSNTSVTTQLNYTETNSTYIRATKDLQDSDALGSGNTMSDNFVLRFELNKTNDATDTGNGSQPLIDISSSLLDAWFNNQDSIGMNITVDRTTTMGYQAIGADNQYTHQGDSAINTYTWVTGIRYCEVIKNATADTVTATIYTNSDYTGSLGTASVSTSGKTFSGLRYLSMRNFADSARSSTVWEMNNVQVYDGVTTIN